MTFIGWCLKNGCRKKTALEKKMVGFSNHDSYNGNYSGYSALT